MQNDNEPNKQPPKKRGRPTGKTRAKGFYDGALTGQEKSWLAEALELDDEQKANLDGEIAAARVVVKRLLMDEEGGLKAAQATLIVAKLQETKHRLEGKQAENLLEAVNTVLEELGFGANPTSTQL
jgi:hypothetical protein